MPAVVEVDKTRGAVLLESLLAFVILGLALAPFSLLQQQLTQDGQESVHHAQVVRLTANLVEALRQAPAAARPALIAAAQQDLLQQMPGKPPASIVLIAPADNELIPTYQLRVRWPGLAPRRLEWLLTLP